MKLMETRLEVFAERAAREQLAATHAPDTVRDSYAAFMRDNREAFLQIPVDVVFTPHDAYNCNSRAMFTDIRENENLSVFTGGTLPSDHPLTAKDYGIYGTPQANLIFRAVHDFYGHFQYGLGFSTFAELRVAAFATDGNSIVPEQYADATQPYVVPYIDALLCESVLQTCVYHLTGQYAEQKAFRVSDTLKTQWFETAHYLRGLA